MKREEAIVIIQELWRYKETDKYTESEIRQALQMAIKALEQETVTEFADRCRECGAKVLGWQFNGDY